MQFVVNLALGDFLLTVSSPSNASLHVPVIKMHYCLSVHVVLTAVRFQLTHPVTQS